MSCPSTKSIAKSNLEKEFVFLASELSDRFPSLDLRFNHRSGSRTLRCLLAEYPDQVLELRLGTEDTTEILFDAILSIKEIARLFDA